MGSNVTNNGLITAPLGEVILAAGATVQIGDTSTPGVRAEITGTESKSENLGSIVASSGKVGLVGALVRNAGRINANQVTAGPDGRIWLRAKQGITLEAGGVITANGAHGGAGTR